MDRPSAPVTTSLVAANVLAFVYEVARVGPQLLLGGGSLRRLAGAGALVPVFVRANGQYWRVVTGGFLHGSLLHLAVNMYSLYILGRFIETIAGGRRMAVVYAVSLVASGLAVAYFARPFDVTVGASGAIFGLFGALFAAGLRLGRAGMRLVQDNLGILALNLIITFTVPGISRWGHVGGLVVGFLVAYGIFKPPPARIAPKTAT
jgi:membrane associated rhomboid family serine protease